MGTMQDHEISGEQTRVYSGAETPGQSPVRNMTQIQMPAASVQQLRSEGSWIEIASRQSSSSLSSADNEIITTGLRVQHDSNLHRRRRARTTGQFVIGTGYRATSAGGGSSQEEYEESESESDRVMTSSNEGIGPSPLQYELRRTSRDMYSATSSETMSEREGDDEDEDDDDENATAVNYPRSSSQRPFEPRPNAFSHPPTSTDEPRIGASYPPNRRPAARSARHSYPQHSPYGGLSPHRYHAEHDEALRASLSTLLSAAAAVRGLPKQTRPSTNNDNNSSPSPSTRVDPTSLRLVPESVARGETPSPARTHTTTTTTTTSSPDPPTKRKATPQSPTHQQHLRSSSKDRRVTKKARTTTATALGIDDISPTLLTWVVSAGVVVLVSALSFSAGYVVGKEAGHAEAMGELGTAAKEAGRCGREAVGEVGRGAVGGGLGLRRLRWGGQGVRV